MVDVADPWPRRLAVAHGDLDAHGDEGEAAVSPDGTRGRLHLHAARRPQPQQRDPRRRPRRRRGARGHRHAATCTTTARRGRRTATTIAYASERSGFYELHLAGAEERQLTSAGADHLEPAWHPDGTRLRRRPRAAQPLRPRGRRRRDAARPRSSPRAAPGAARAGRRRGAIVGTYEDHATPPELRLAGARPRATPPRRAPTRRAPHAALEEVTFPSFDGLEIPAFLRRPQNASRERPVPAVVYPHGGPTDAYLDDWDGHAQYFVDKGYAWLAPNFRGSTGYGRDFERPNHGVWGVDDTEDCLAAADYLRDARLGRRRAPGHLRRQLRLVHGAAPRSTDDPEHRFRCAVAKYGDCDILTSWAQGDRDGVQDLERMMGHPSTAREAYRAGSPFHRLAERRGAAAHRPRRARRAREPEAVRAARRRAAPAGQDLRVRDLPRPRATASCAPARSSTSTAGSSASSTGTSCEDLALARAD